MSYLALYRKYRPTKFNEVFGQKYVIDILKNAIITKNISHAYLFSGPRGTGKTSVAKIFAKSVNCLNPVDGEMCEECEICKALKENDIDIIEIDAASNNGVDEIREIRNNVKLLPSIGQYKIYIIDEVHMLSIGAFNALLKTLEEPPKHVIFILATTEIQKIPLTIISRCQKFDFKKITISEIELKLKEILKKEKKEVSEDVLKLISEISDGGLRDAINLLDQIIMTSKKEITVDEIYNINGKISNTELEQLFDYIIQKNIPGILNKIEEFYNNGKNIYSIIERLIILIRNININNNVNNYFSKNEQEKLLKYSGLPNEITNYLASRLIKLSNEIKKAENQRLVLEVTLLEILEELNHQNEQKIEQNVNNLKSNNLDNDKKTSNESIENISREIFLTRINNTLAGASKKILQENNKKLSKISDYISNEKYNKVVNILKNSKLIVSSELYMIFSYENEKDANLFNINLEKIEKLLNEILDQKYKVIAVTNEEWNKIKKDYIKNIENGIKYKLQSEPEIVKKSNKKNDTFAESIFGEESIDIK